MSQQEKKQSGNVTISGISGGSVDVENVVTGDVKGDVVAGDKITHMASQDSSQAMLEAALVEWRRELEAKIEALSVLDADEKEELKKQAAMVETEAKKGETANPGKIARLINSISAMAPDIIEVTAKTLQSPFAGVGLVLEKINDRIKLERQDTAKE